MVSPKKLLFLVAHAHILRDGRKCARAHSCVALSLRFFPTRRLSPSLIPVAHQHTYADPHTSTNMQNHGAIQFFLSILQNQILKLVMKEKKI